MSAIINLDRDPRWVDNASPTWTFGAATAMTATTTRAMAFNGLNYNQRFQGENQFAANVAAGSYLASAVVFSVRDNATPYKIKADAFIDKSDAILSLYVGEASSPTAVDHCHLIGSGRGTLHVDEMVIIKDYVANACFVFEVFAPTALAGEMVNHSLFVQDLTSPDTNYTKAVS